jgi:hypothetical protein
VAEAAAGTSEAASLGEQQADASAEGGRVRRRKDETYEKYKARRDKRMQEAYKSLAPEEIERRMKIGQANSKRVPWNKGRKHSPGGCARSQLSVQHAPALGSAAAEAACVLERRPAAGAGSWQRLHHRAVSAHLGQRKRQRAILLLLLLVLLLCAAQQAVHRCAPLLAQPPAMLSLLQRR